MASKILDIAFRHKANRLGIETYSMAQLERDSGLHHSMIARAAEYDPEQNKGSQPKIETVRKMAAALEVSIHPDLEDAFYNAFDHASPRQRGKVQQYVESHASDE